MCVRLVAGSNAAEDPEQLLLSAVGSSDSSDELLQLLLTHLASEVTGSAGAAAVELACDLQREAKLVALLAAGAPSSTDAVSAAARRGNVPMLQLLLQQPQRNEHASPHRSTGTFSPLLTAISCGHVEAAEYLLSTGADITGEGPGGFTALELTIQHSDQLHSLVTQLLADSPAQIKR